MALRRRFSRIVTANTQSIQLGGNHAYPEGGRFRVVSFSWRLRPITSRPFFYPPGLPVRANIMDIEIPEEGAALRASTSVAIFVSGGASFQNPSSIDL